MSLSPRVTFTVEENKIKVTEENYPDAGYRVTGPLENNEVQLGKAAVLRIPLHSLSGVSPLLPAQIGDTRQEQEVVANGRKQPNEF